MSVAPLSSIDWHDLPVSEVRISETGLSLVIEPYNKASASYGTRILRITDARTIELKIVGSLTKKDASSMEIASFSHSLLPSGRITGTLGLLPGEAGYWEVTFVDACCEIVDA